MAFPKIVISEPSALPPAVVVKLTDDDFAAAADYEKRVLSKVSHFENYTGQSWPNRYRNGHLAEIGMNRWLSGSGINYEWLTNDQGYSDICDFLIHTSYRPVSFDIKATSNRDSRELVVGEKQWLKCTRTYFGLVVGRLSLPTKELWMLGWITTRAFARVAQKVERNGRAQRIYTIDDGLQDMARVIAT